MGPVTIDLDNINLDDGNFDDDHHHPETIVLIRLISWCNRYKQHQTCKKDKQGINTYGMASKKSVELVYNKR